LFHALLRTCFPPCRCNEQQQTVVEVQSQLRIGMSDLGVNGRRNERFMLDLSKAVQAGSIPQGVCIEDTLAAAASAAG